MARAPDTLAALNDIRAELARGRRRRRRSAKKIIEQLESISAVLDCKSNDNGARHVYSIFAPIEHLPDDLRTSRLASVLTSNLPLVARLRIFCRDLYEADKETRTAWVRRLDGLFWDDMRLVAERCGPPSGTLVEEVSWDLKHLANHKGELSPNEHA